MKIETKRKKRMKNCAICFGRCFAFDAGASLHNPTHISNFEWNHKKNPINKIHIFFSAHYFGWLAQHSRFALASITPFHYVYFIAFITTESHRKIHLITRVQQLPHFSSANILDTRRVCGRPKTQILTIENCAQKKWKKIKTELIDKNYSIYFIGHICRCFARPVPSCLRMKITPHNIWTRLASVNTGIVKIVIEIERHLFYRKIEVPRMFNFWL